MLCLEICRDSDFPPKHLPSLPCWSHQVRSEIHDQVGSQGWKAAALVRSGLRALLWMGCVCCLWEQGRNQTRSHTETKQYRGPHTSCTPLTGMEGRGRTGERIIPAQ